MKLALALDTSRDRASVAVLREDHSHLETLASVRVTEGMRHGVELFPAIERVLADAGHPARALDLVAVGTGPGSFTGLRIGVSAARALAYATGADLLGVPSCDAWAATVPTRGSRLAVLLDSRARRVHLALYEPDAETGWSRVEGPELLAAEVARTRLADDVLVVGDGPDAHPHVFRGLARVEPVDAPDAAEVGRLALLRALRGERDRIDAVVPLYLTRTAAERALDTTDETTGDPQ